MFDIKYILLEEIGEYLDQAAALVIEGGQWSSEDYVRGALESCSFCVLAILDGTVIGVSVAKHKLKTSNISYCTGGLLSVNKKYRKLGIAGKLLNLRNKHGLDNGIDLFLATINPKNIPSIKCVMKEGYNYWNDIYYTETFFEHRFYIANSNISEKHLKELFGDANPQNLQI